MVTTNSLIQIDAFGSDAAGLIHLTGTFQMLARVTVGGADRMPAHIELSFDAAQVRGVGLESGVRYQARGAYRISDDPKELPLDLDLVSTFELLGYGREKSRPSRLLLVVPLHVTVQADGRSTTCMEDPQFLPCPDGE
jgi:hypothetical protein